MTYHLSLDGVDDYLQLPTMSFHKVEIDGIIYAPTDGNNDYIIDAQPGVTNGYVILKPDGTVIRAGAAITVTPSPPVCGSRSILTLEGNSPTYFTEPNLQGTDDITLFADHMSTSNLKADVYSVKVYDGLGNLIAHYDFTTQEYEAGALIPDLTGNGYNATINGGTWVDETSSDVAQHIYFDGVDDYASTVVHGGGSGYNEGEIDLLIYSDNDYSSNSLFIHAGSSNFHIYIDINGNINWNSSTISSITINNVTLTNGQPFTWWDERIKIHFIGVSGNLYNGNLFAYTGGDRYYLKANLYGLQYYRTNSVVTKFDIANGSILDVAPNDPADTMTLTGGTWVKGGGISNYYLSMDGVDDSLITTLPTGVTADYVELDVLFTDPQINAYAYILGDTSIRINNGSLQFSTGVTGFKMGVRTLLTIDLTANSSPQNILSVFYRGKTGAGYGSYACEGNIYDVKYYTGGKGGTLLAHYDLSTSTVKDQSGNGNDATLNGGLWVVGTSTTTTPATVAQDQLAGYWHFMHSHIRAESQEVLSTYWDMTIDQVDPYQVPGISTNLADTTLEDMHVPSTVTGNDGWKFTESDYTSISNFQLSGNLLEIEMWAKPRFGYGDITLLSWDNNNLVKLSNAGNTISTLAGAISQAFSDSTWYKINLYMDFGAKTESIYVNDTQIASRSNTNLVVPTYLDVGTDWMGAVASLKAYSKQLTSTERSQNTTVGRNTGIAIEGVVPNETTDIISSSSLLGTASVASSQLRMSFYKATMNGTAGTTSKAGRSIYYHSGLSGISNSSQSSKRISYAHQSLQGSGGISPRAYKVALYKSNSTGNATLMSGSMKTIYVRPTMDGESTLDPHATYIRILKSAIPGILSLDSDTTRVVYGEDTLDSTSGMSPQDTKIIDSDVVSMSGAGSIDVSSTRIEYNNVSLLSDGSIETDSRYIKYTAGTLEVTSSVEVSYIKESYSSMGISATSDMYTEGIRIPEFIATESVKGTMMVSATKVRLSDINMGSTSIGNTKGTYIRQSLVPVDSYGDTQVSSVTMVNVHSNNYGVAEVQVTKSVTTWNTSSVMDATSGIRASGIQATDIGCDMLIDSDTTARSIRIREDIISPVSGADIQTVQTVVHLVDSQALGNSSMYAEPYQIVYNPIGLASQSDTHITTTNGYYTGSNMDIESSLVASSDISYSSQLFMSVSSMLHSNSVRIKNSTQNSKVDSDISLVSSAVYSLWSGLEATSAQKSVGGVISGAKGSLYGQSDLKADSISMSIKKIYLMGSSHIGAKDSKLVNYTFDVVITSSTDSKAINLRNYDVSLTDVMNSEVRANRIAYGNNPIQASSNMNATPTRLSMFVSALGGDFIIDVSPFSMNTSDIHLSAHSGTNIYGSRLMHGTVDIEGTSTQQSRFVRLVMAGDTLPITSYIVSSTGVTTLKTIKLRGYKDDLSALRGSIQDMIRCKGVL